GVIEPAVLLRCVDPGPENVVGVVHDHLRNLHVGALDLCSEAGGGKGAGSADDLFWCPAPQFASALVGFGKHPMDFGVVNLFRSGRPIEPSRGFDAVELFEVELQVVTDLAWPDIGLWVERYRFIEDDYAVQKAIADVLNLAGLVELLMNAKAKDAQ